MLHETELTPEKRYDLQMELNQSYERLSTKHQEMRELTKAIDEEERTRDQILGELGLRGYDVV